MSLVADIGNTKLKFCRINSGVVAEETVFSECPDPLFFRDEKELVICSVVPSATSLLRYAFVNTTGIEPYVVSYNDIFFKTSYEDITRLGTDRICNAAYAVTRHGGNVIIIDIGSAVTVDFVDNNGIFIGGMIMPGIELQLSALSDHTALLPELKAQKPLSPVGTGTESCIISGVIHGIAGACANFIKLISESSGKDAIVVLSGGGSKMISSVAGFEHTIEENTVPLGAYELYLRRKL